MDIRNVLMILIDPVFYLFAGLIVIFFSKRHQRKITCLLIIYVYIISIPFTPQVFYNKWKLEDTFDSKITYDAVVVLVGITSLDQYKDIIGKPKISFGYFQTLKGVERILAGIHLVKTGHAKLFLFGSFYDTFCCKESFSEVEKVKPYLLASGLKEDQFCVYGIVNKTLDEAIGVRSYVDKNPDIKKILLVTSEIHMRRAKALFAKQGLKVDTFSVEKINERINIKSFVPNIDVIANSYNCLYEPLVYFGYYIKEDI